MDRVALLQELLSSEQPALPPTTCAGASVNTRTCSRTTGNRILMICFFMASFFRDVFRDRPRVADGWMLRLRSGYGFLDDLVLQPGDVPAHGMPIAAVLDIITYPPRGRAR